MFLQPTRLSIVTHDARLLQSKMASTSLAQLSRPSRYDCVPYEASRLLPHVILRTSVVVAGKISHIPRKLETI